jgi:hypothetical protein
MGNKIGRGFISFAWERSCTEHPWMQGPSGRIGWSNQSWLLDRFLGATVIWAIGVVMVAGTFLSCKEQRGTPSTVGSEASVSAHLERRSKKAQTW